MQKAQKETPQFTKYQLFVIAILALLQFTVVIDFAIISPLGDMLMKKLEINTSQFGLLVSCYAFGAGISGILAATFADKFDRKKFLLVFYTGFLLGTLCCGLSTNYTLLLMSRSFTGVFGGVISSISLSIVSDLFSLNQRGRVMGYIQMAFAASQVLGIPTGIVIANHLGWNATFFMISILAFVIGLIIALKLKPLKEHLKLQTNENPLLRFWHVLSNTNYVIGFVLITMISVGSSMLMPFSATFLINNIHITQAQLPMLFMITGAAMMIFMPLFGKLSDKMDKFKLFLAGSIISILMTLIYTNLTPIPLWSMIILNIIMFVGISSRMIPGMALNTAIPDMKDRGAYMSLCSSLQQFSNGFAALIAGLIVVQQTKTSPLEHYNILGYIVAALSIICIFLIYLVSKIVKAKNT